MKEWHLEEDADDARNDDRQQTRHQVATESAEITPRGPGIATERNYPRTGYVRVGTA